MSEDAKQTYEDLIMQAGEIKRDLDVVYNPTMGSLKKAFLLIFGGANMSGADFKRLSDMQFYQGGKPKVDSPPKESTLAFQVSNLMRLEALIDKNNFGAYLGAQGVRAEAVVPIEDFYAVSKDDEKKLIEAWEGAGIDTKLPSSRKEALGLLLDRAQNLQGEILEIQEGLSDVAVSVEESFQIAKGNFMKAAALHALRLKRGAGVMGEKLDSVVDNAENLLKAVEPLITGNQ